MIVADTDVLIDFLAGRNAGERVGAKLERGALATTAVTRFELLSGARDAAQEKLLRQLLDTLLTLALDQEAADRAAAVRRSLEHMGRPIGMGDSLIAGIVLSRHAILLTRNRRHFKAVPDLQLA